jgi:hypothetical protein
MACSETRSSWVSDAQKLTAGSAVIARQPGLAAVAAVAAEAAVAARAALAALAARTRAGLRVPKRPVPSRPVA